MVRVCIEVEGNAGRPRLSVKAESIRMALKIAGERNPGCELRVVFPLDPETFFVRGPASDAGSEVIEIAA
ncbi:MAG: hypothetical protein M3151_15660 [Actinomycetota bacterium]|nr:hypothetical protein [Actinomycetota bacterium]